MTATNEPEQSPVNAALLARAQAGDAEAFSEMAEVCETRLFREAAALCHDLTTAEDLTVETLEEAWKSLKNYHGGCRFSTWLYAILVHRYQKWLRKARSRPVPLASLKNEAGDSLVEQLVDGQSPPAEVLQRKEQIAGLQEAINALPPKHQEVVLLRFYEDASLPEIAAALDLSPGTVKSRLHYALEKLRGMKTILNLWDPSGDTRT